MAKILHEFLSCSYWESYFQEFSIHFKMWYSVYWYIQTHMSHYMYLLDIKSPKTLNLERHKSSSIDLQFYFIPEYKLHLSMITCKH